MTNSPRNLNQALQQSSIALLLTILLVIICYWFVDKPVAFFVARHHIANFIFLKWFTYIPAAFLPLVLLSYPILIIRFCKRLSKPWDNALWNIANSAVIVYFVVSLLKQAFGRAWIATWVDNNPSLLSNGTYGFHWFHGSAGFASFPSGHSAMIIAITTAIWLIFKNPLLKITFSILSLLVTIGLIGMNYHYVSDVIAGFFVGWVSAFFVIIRGNLLVNNNDNHL